MLDLIRTCAVTNVASGDTFRGIVIAEVDVIDTTTDTTIDVDEDEDQDHAQDPEDATAEDQVTAGADQDQEHREEIVIDVIDLDLPQEIDGVDTDQDLTIGTSDRIQEVEADPMIAKVDEQLNPDLGLDQDPDQLQENVPNHQQRWKYRKMVMET